jgi:hypothetical protein
MNGRLADVSFEEPDQPLQAINVFFQSIKEATMDRVFQEWMDRLAQCCVAVGGSVEGTYKKSEDNPGFTRPVSRC